VEKTEIPHEKTKNFMEKGNSKENFKSGYNATIIKIE